MQRDAYAALVKKRAKVMLPLRILQVNGHWTHELVFDEVFVGYDNRRIALMTYGGAGGAGGGGGSTDVVVPDFATLLRVHKPHMRYRLLPLLCIDQDAFAVARAVCAAPHSPFTIDDRVDPLSLTHRFALGCAGRDRMCEFFKDSILPEEWSTPVSSRKMPIMGVAFHAALMTEGKIMMRQQSKAVAEAPAAAAAVEESTQTSGSAAASGETTAPSPPPLSSSSADGGAAPPDSKSDAAASADAAADGKEPAAEAGTQQRRYVAAAALITTHESLTERTVMERWHLKRYTDSPLYFELAGNTESMQKLKRCRGAVTHVMGIRTPISPNGLRPLLNLARQKGIHIFEKNRHGEYKFLSL